MWVLFTIIWLAGAGGTGVAIWADELRQVGDEIVASMTSDPSEADYEALCAKLRAQAAAGGPVDKIRLVPRLEVVVEKGVARVVAAPARCLVVLAKEKGVDLIPVFFKIVGSDGSEILELERADGTRTPFDFQSARTLEGADHSGMYGYFAFVLAVPLVLFAFGSGIWWVAAGFKSR